jgi:DNA-binding IscR family transcriptional regulator
VKAKELRQRFGEDADLPSVEEATLSAQAMLRQPFEDTTSAIETDLKRAALADLVKRQRNEREALKQTQTHARLKRYDRPAHLC